MIRRIKFIDEKVKANFWSKVNTEGECWNWIASKFKFGYGQFYINGKNLYAHRVSYVIQNGSIPKGLFVCHKCDNPSCVRPSHLFLGSQLENVLDMVKKGRHGARTRNYKTSPFTVEERRLNKQLKAFAQYLKFTLWE